jgi:glycosyltransferase involved in cell wall biosynthesis
LHRNQGKLRPISLGLAAWRIADLPKPLPPKSVDVFFAGAIQTDLRRRGAALLAVLHRSGVTVDFVEGHLDRAEYLSRMARAHLAWSPEGLGWQCFRHFEAAVAGAIPVINRQRIEMRHPLRAGEHAFYYDPDGEDLIGVIRHALADKQRLRGMADAARQYVLAHHTHQSVAGEILDAVREISDGISEGR